MKEQFEIKENVPGVPAKPRSNILNYMRAVQLGIILVVIGMIITVGVPGFVESESGGFYDFYPSYPGWVEQVTTMGRIIYYVGLCLILLGLFSLALIAEELHLYLRIGLVIAFSIVFAAGINVLRPFSLSSLF